MIAATGGGASVLAAMAATRTIPIVFTTGGNVAPTARFLSVAIRSFPADGSKLLHWRRVMPSR